MENAYTYINRGGNLLGLGVWGSEHSKESVTMTSCVSSKSSLFKVKMISSDLPHRIVRITRYDFVCATQK